MGTLVGALGGAGRARVDARGAIQVVGATWALDWWIGGDDRWHLPGKESAVRQQTVEGTPVVETSMRVPGGDAVQRVYGIGGPGGVLIVEIENASPAAFVVALTVEGARAVAADGGTIAVDGRDVLLGPAPPARWTAGTDPLAPETVGADTGSFPELHDRKGALRAAVLYPLSHRNRLRVALVTSNDPPGPVDLALAADAPAAAAGWHALLEAGMRVVVPDPLAQDAISLARSQVLLDPDPDAGATAALEDWGHDAEAEWAWRGLSFSARRAARRRDVPVDDSTPSGLLRATRAALVRDEQALDVAPALPAAWRGQDLELHDAPTRLGRLSYAIRWHGERPALLWEVVDPAAGLVVRAPALDPSWSTTDPSGEALLATPARFGAELAALERRSLTPKPAGGLRSVEAEGGDAVARELDLALELLLGAAEQVDDPAGRRRAVAFDGRDGGLRGRVEDPHHESPGSRRIAETVAPWTRKGRPVTGCVAPRTPPPRTRSMGTSTSSAAA